MLYSKNKLHSDLHIFLTIVATLIIIGCLFIYSASSIYALELFGSPYYFIKRQFIGLIVGFCCFFIARIIPLSVIKKLSPFFLLIALSLTALTLFPYFSYRVHGASRWLYIGTFTFQPSELLKIALPLFLAYFLDKHRKINHLLSKSYALLLFILFLISFILLKQPDFGLTITLLLTTLLMFFIVQLNLKQVSMFTGALGISALLLIIARPYRLQRLLVFLNPWHDPQGAGFQIIQSLIAIGSGHWLGMGVSQSKQKFFYLPMQHTDFIFSIIAEETGFIGCLFLITLYILFLYFGLRIAQNIQDKFAAYSILGFVLIINLQTIINIAVATNLVPTKGIGLPFISYGNTALVCNFIIIGLIINMVHNTKELSIARNHYDTKTNYF
ncbi:MAG: putative lipid II flippase FtsW [Candidatus Babeliales bacterium]